jgi:hypothetical protein
VSEVRRWCVTGCARMQGKHVSWGRGRGFRASRRLSCLYVHHQPLVLERLCNMSGGQGEDFPVTPPVNPVGL